MNVDTPMSNVVCQVLIVECKVSNVVYQKASVQYLRLHVQYNYDSFSDFKCFHRCNYIRWIYKIYCVLLTTLNLQQSKPILSKLCLMSNT